MTHCSDISIPPVDHWLERPWFAPLLLLAVLLGLYLPYIIAHPEFYLDDWYFLALLTEHGIPHPFEGTTYLYHAAMRPLFMLTMAWDMVLFDDASGWYYVTNLLIVWGGAVALYHLLRAVAQEFFETDARLVPLLLAVAFVAHADMFYGAVWISNRTESFMILLYMLGVLSALRYFKRASAAWLVATVLLFTLSLATKAQAAHFPLLFLFVGWLMRRGGRTAVSHRGIVLASLSLFGVSMLYALVTMQYDPALTVLPFAWIPEKIMAAIGILLVAINPSIAEPVYTFFVHNKLYAGIALVPLSLLGVWLLRRLAGRDRWTLLAFAAVYAISMYPRIMHHAAPRVNAIQVVVVIVVLCWIALRIPRIPALLLLAAFTISQFLGTIFVELPRWYFAADNTRYKNVVALEQERPGRYYMLVAWQHFDPYAMHFFRTGHFGRDSTWMVSPLRIDRSFGHRGFTYDITQRDGSITFESNDARVYFAHDTSKTYYPGFHFDWQREGKPKRFMEVTVSWDSLPRDLQYYVERNYRLERIMLTDDGTH